MVTRCCFYIHGWMCVCVNYQVPGWSPISRSHSRQACVRWGAQMSPIHGDHPPLELKGTAAKMLVPDTTTPFEGSIGSYRGGGILWAFGSLKQRLWQDLLPGRFISLVNHTRRYQNHFMLSRVQSASKWFKTLCVKGNMWRRSRPPFSSVSQT